MAPSLKLTLNTNAAQFEQLCRLQTEFAAACNRVSPLAQANRCWNRVALHHLVYRQLRAEFPQLGSQMACNAIYSVARTFRAVLQHKESPWYIERRPNQALPAIRFTDSAPVYFDRHTLSLKHNVLSMFTLDGRLHFELNLVPADASQLQQQKIREIVLLRLGAQFVLQIWLDEKASLPEGESNDGDFPEYLLVSPDSVDAPAGTAVSSDLSSW